MVEEAGPSLRYAGFHHRFDGDASRELGRQVARYVLEIGGKQHMAIPLD